MSLPILLVDDDPNVIDTISIMLENQGFSVTSAANGEDCVAAIESGFSGLVLLDVMMPRLNGWQTIEQLVKKNKIEQVVICMMTCITDPGAEASKVSQYVHGYIEKPFKGSELLQHINQYKDLIPK